MRRRVRSPSRRRLPRRDKRSSSRGPRLGTMTALCNNLIIRPKTDFNADMATLCAELDRMEFVWLRLGDSVVRACTITPTACLAVEIQIADRLEEDAVLFTFQALEGDRAVVPALCAHLRRAMANTSDTPVALTRLGLAPFDVPPGLEAYPPIRELDPFVCYSAIVASLRSDKPHQRQDAAASVGRLLATRASAESMVAYEPLVQAVWHAALQEEYGVPPHAALALATMASYDLGAFTLRDSLRVDLCQRPSARSPDVLTNVPAMWARLADRLWAKAKVALTQGPRVVVGVPAALAPRPPLLPWHAARTQIALAPADPHSVRVKIEQLLEASGACYIYKPQKFKVRRAGKGRPPARFLHPPAVACSLPPACGTTRWACPSLSCRYTRRPHAGLWLPWSEPP